MTKKPCPGCGGRIPRTADSVCQYCAAAIASWNQIKSGTLLKRYQIGYAPHCNAIPGGGEIGEALHAIALAASRGNLDVPFASVSDGNGSDIFPRTYSYDPQVVTMEPALASALFNAYVIAKKSVNDAEKRGKESGRNLLVGLNDGSISMDDYMRRSQ